MPGSVPVLLIVILMTGLVQPWAQAADYEERIRPILQEFCNRCHSTEKHKGDLDLERFATLVDMQKEPLVWQEVVEQMKSGEMPPKEKPQPSADQKAALLGWVEKSLDDLALANAGDPGPVILRRLSNMEYTYTLRDLTGVEGLDPAREFPVDGAAGEGFTNAGAALVMSPTLLTKYLDAAKEVATHAVLTPEGLRFSPSTSAQDWTDEALGKIRALYRRHTESGKGSQVVQQGIPMEVGSDSGRLPLGKYLAAAQGKGSAEGLSAKYVETLRTTLDGGAPSLLLDGLREKFRSGTLEAADVEPWQQSLWRFASIGHIGKAGGPTAWQEPVVPLAAQLEAKLKLTAPADGGEVTLFLATSDAGDGAENDAAVWQNPRLVAPGRPDLPLKHLPAVLEQLNKRRDAVAASVTKCLAAAQQAESATERLEVTTLAQKHGVEPDFLATWLDYLGIGSTGPVKLGPLHTQKLESAGAYQFIKGWTGGQDLSVLANSSDGAVRIPGMMKPHGIATHPSPTTASVIAWRSPVAAAVKITGQVQHAHPECGNGITWALEMRRGNTREVLASGVSAGAQAVDMGSHEGLRVLPGDAIAVVIGPRDGNHSCDMTAVDLLITDGAKDWDLAKELSPDILAGNPHADRQGHADVWHFFGEPATASAAPKIPAGSVLALWRKSRDAGEREQLATQVQQLLTRGPEGLPPNSPDRALHQQLLSFNGPFLAAALKAAPTAGDPDMAVQAPSVVEVKIPASLADGTEFVALGRPATPEASVQMQVLTVKPEKLSGLAASKAQSAQANGKWSDNNLRTIHSAPILVNEGSAARKRFEAAFTEFRNLFPIALCYTKIVPVDEVVTLRLYYREDEHLRRLILTDGEIQELDRLWDELRFVSQAPLKQVDAYDQLWQYATQDADPKAFEPLREPLRRDAEVFRQQVAAAEPKHVQAVLDFATKVWRRPLSEAEQENFRQLYKSLRKQELPHQLAVRTLLTRVLVSPAFLYRGEKPAPGPKPAPVNDWELATRLGYFLWSSAPDEELRRLAAEGKLREALPSQARRMLKDARVRRLATEFGCQWMHVRDVATLDEKSERHFPTFLSLRESMQEEAVRFLIDLFQEDRSVLSLLEADHTFVNGPLAKHYGIEAAGEEWRRVEGMRQRGRGGILGFSAALAKQSGASRTSPILRGTWLCEVILGEKLPIPPKGVPTLPEEAPQGLTERQLTERHSKDERCAGCHKRIDPFGYALEGFDAIGAARTKDAAGLTVDAVAALPDGSQANGLDGMRNYILTARRDDFLRQFCRKLLGYALGRSVQLSDKPLIQQMLAALKAQEYKVGTLIDLIVQSPQFREVRGLDYGAN